MITTFIIGLLFVLAFVAFIGSFRAAPSERSGVLAASIVLGAFGFIFAATQMIAVVPDGHVAVTTTFKQLGDEPLNPGIHVIMPWQSTIEEDIRIQSYGFTDDPEDAGDPIRTQAKGGGNLTLELTVQLAPSQEAADDLLREVGRNWFDTVALPSVRSCGRDSTTSTEVEEAFTTKRGEVTIFILECITEDLEPFGINVFDVQLRDVDPGTAVRTAIDEKQKAEQQLKRAQVALQEAELEAQKEAVAAFGVSQAEQIVACGGTETTRVGDGGEEITIIEPNSECEDQFSDEYLQWLYINQLDKIQGLVITTPEFNGELFVEAPQGQVGAGLNE